MSWCQDQRTVLSSFVEMASFVGGRSGEPLKGEIIELEEIADSGEGSGRGTGQHELNSSQKT